MQQVITIGSQGQISGLQRKPGQGVDLRQFGHAKITRASEIVWHEAKQMWYVDVLQEAGRGVLTPARWRAVSMDFTHIACEFQTGDGFETEPLFFHDYDEAVRAEIAYLDALRLSGQF